MLRRTLNPQKHALKYLAAVSGKIQSMTPALGNIAQMCLRRLYILMNEQHSWSARVWLTAGIKEDVKFILEHLDSFNGQSIWQESFQHVTHTGASAHALGGHVDGNNWVWESLTLPEQWESSTLRELLAVLMLVRKLRLIYQNRRVLFRVDNQGLYYILKKGGSKIEKIMTGVRQIFMMLWEMNITWDIEWVPREENVLADYISKQIEKDDWSVKQDVFEGIDSEWGPHTIDRMSNSWNSMLPRCNTKYWEPSAEGWDCFTQDWGGENNWVHPPLADIGRVLEHAKQCKATMTLLTPAWKNQPWWPLMVGSEGQFRSFIVDYMILDRFRENFNLGSHSSLFGHGPLQFDMIALRIDFA